VYAKASFHAWAEEGTLVFSETRGKTCENFPKEEKTAVFLPSYNSITPQELTTTHVIHQHVLFFPKLGEYVYG
jgi:hypothetical protein